MSNAIIYSSQRISTSLASPSSFLISFTNKIFSGKYKLSEVFIPNSNYTVNALNNQIYFTENSTAKVATIVNGFYNSSTFVTAVATALTTASGGYNTYTGTLGSATQLATLSATYAFSLTFGTNTSNSCAQLLGFTNTDTSSATSQTGTLVVNMSPILTYNIRVNNIESTADSTSNGSTFIIPVNVNTMAFTQYDPSGHYPQYITFNNPTSTLQVSVTDQNNNPLNLNGVNWYFVLSPVE